MVHVAAGAAVIRIAMDAAGCEIGGTGHHHPPVSHHKFAVQVLTHCSNWGKGSNKGVESESV